MDVPKFQKKLLFMPVKAAQDCAFVSDGEGSAMSPMTELAVNLEMSSMSTPRRKLSLSNSINPTPERSNSITESLESGIGGGSPFLEQCPEFESPTIENIRARKCSGTSQNNNSSSNLRRQLMTRRSFSSPVFQRKQLEPLNFDEFSPSLKKSPKRSNPCNVLKPINHVVESFEEKHSDLSLLEMADQFPESDDDFEIKKRKYIGRSHSAPTVSQDYPDIFSSGSSCHSTASNDDGFFDELKDDINECGISTSAPSNIIGLINYPIFKDEKKEEDKENQVPRPRREFANPNKLQTRARSCSLSVKRDSPATQSSSPVKRTKRPRHGVYRSKSFYGVNQEENYSTEKQFDLPTPTRALQRSQSFDVRHTKSPDLSKLFDIDDKTLIGDKSKQYSLPTCASKHPDLKGITPDTLADLLDGKYKNDIDEYFIIDSRYPYEFEGGHIKHALNIYEKQDLLDKFLKSPPTEPLEKRQVLIFHCEFSSKRGPSMSRFLRNKDRDAHQDSYPNLYYPELYLLEGGYKEFYALKPGYCVPQMYREMLDPDYQQQLKLFTKRSKSWSEDRSVTGRARRRPLLRF